MAACVIRKYDVTEHVREGMEHEVIVSFQGKEIERFAGSTQTIVWNQLESAGYKRAVEHGDVILT